MELNKIGELSSAVMRLSGRERSDALEAFIEANPGILMTDIIGTAALLGRCPFPAVDGNPPVFRNRPFFDARRYGFNDALIDREDQL